MFDKAPEVEQDNIALLVENKRLKITGKNLSLNHQLLIGENYEVLKNLLLVYTRIENGQRVGCIDVIYIDPPYNTERSRLDGNSYKDELVSSKFIYRDKFRRTGWLNMMNERLKLARELLSPNGVIFISIDDNEQAYLKVLCDEIFGEENFVGNIIWSKKNYQFGAKNLQKNHEYILVYSKNDISSNKILYIKGTQEKKLLVDEKNQLYYRDYSLDTSFGHERLCDRPTMGYVVYFNQKNKDIIIDDKYDLLKAKNINSTLNDVYKENKILLSQGYVAIYPPLRKGNILGCWCRGITEIKQLLNNNSLDIIKIKNKWKIYPKIYVDSCFQKLLTYPLESVLGFSSNNGTSILSSILLNKNFNNPKNPELLRFILGAYFNKNATILDFFAGSGTTGQAVMELNQEDGGNRRFILCTNNENNIAKDICWERLYRVIKGIGSNGQKINWKYSKQVPYLSNNTISTFEIQHYKCGITEDCQKLFDIAIKELKKLNINDQFNLSGVSLSRALSSLHPYKCINKEEK